MLMHHSKHELVFRRLEPGELSAWITPHSSPPSPGPGFGLSLIVAIGAQNAFVLRQGLRGEHVLVVVLICAVSDVILIALGIAGIGSLLELAPWLLDAMRIGGAAFLLTYAVIAGRRALRPGELDAETSGAPVALWPTVLTAVALTWLNPHVYLDTILLLGSVAGTHGDDRWWFGVGAAAGSIVWFCVSRVRRTAAAAAVREAGGMADPRCPDRHHHGGDRRQPAARSNGGVRSFALVAVGGAAGTLSRYGVAEALDADRLFPLATFLVNVTGSFALGALLAVLLVRDDSAPANRLRLLLGTGFLGGYTTYSALAVETDTLLRGDHVALGLTYAVGSVVAGLLAAFAGVAAARAVAR